VDTRTVIGALLRGSHLLALASLFGTLLSLLLVAPAGLRAALAEGPAARHRLVRLAKCSAGLAVLLGIGWMFLEAAAIAGTASLSGTVAVLGKVMHGTRFGQLMLVRLALLALALPFLGGRNARLTIGLLLAGTALGMQGLLGHAGASGGSLATVLVASEAVHLLAAGAWLGGLVPLFLLVGSLPPAAAASVCESFTPVGLGAVLAIACTAVIQAWQLIGGLAGLFGTAYGHVALLKLLLFFVLLVLAGINRLVLTERLRDPVRPVTRLALRTSIGAETLIGAAVIVVAAFLASTIPSAHVEPVWPFAIRPALDLLTDPVAQRLLLRALAPSLIALLLVAWGWFWRPIFLPALAGLVVCLVLAWPEIEPLVTVAAYPTTFDTSPTGFAAASIVRGGSLFAAHCVTCHGSNAQGDGPVAKSLPISPMDLTASHVWAAMEGDLYWSISRGIETSPGQFVMPAFGKQLASADIWSLIDFLKANNAGFSMRTSARWNQPIGLPGFDAICADGAAIDRDDLRHKVVHIIAADHTVTPPSGPAGIPMASIVVARDRSVKPAGTACVAVATDAWNAVALLAGEKPEALAGTEVLVDQNGWLRLRWRPGDPGGWHQPSALDAAIRDIAAHPLALTAGGGHDHHH